MIRGAYVESSSCGLQRKYIKYISAQNIVQICVFPHTHQGVYQY
jgi:hypothetical protein